MNRMKVLELFAGTRSIGKAFEKRGHEVFSVDWDERFENIDLNIDISKLTFEKVIEMFGKPDVIWASPDCTTFSVAAISKHRRKDKATGNLVPISEYAKFCDEANVKMIQLIKELNPELFFIENPRGGMRKMSWIRDIPRYTVTYCKYGERRMKPTDIWTNHPNPKFIPPCKNGDPCHEAAPRGSRTGTQRTGNKVIRSMIPTKLCEHIVDICEEYMEGTRVCDVCGKRHYSGYFIYDEEYYCSDECLHIEYTDEEYQEIYKEDNGYWTEWS